MQTLVAYKNYNNEFLLVTDGIRLATMLDLDLATMFVIISILIFIQCCRK